MPNGSSDDTIIRFSDRIRLPLMFDATRLQADLAHIAADDAWIEHLVKQNYSGEWDVLPLRAPAGATHPVMMIYADPTATDFVNTPWLSRAPYFQAVISAFECPLQTVRLMRLTPGSVIHEHSDYDLDVAQGTARVHVPVTTNPGVEFKLNRTPVAMAEGSAWYLRLSDPHSVANRGTTDRVHLVLDCVANDWLVDMLARGAADGHCAR